MATPGMPEQPESMECVQATLLLIEPARENVLFSKIRAALDLSRKRKTRSSSETDQNRLVGAKKQTFGGWGNIYSY